MMMDDQIEDGELQNSSGDEKAAGGNAVNSVPADAPIAPAPMLAYRNSSTARAAVAGSSDEEQSSDQDSDDENCHLKAPNKKRKARELPSRRMFQPAFTADQAATLLPRLKEVYPSQSLTQTEQQPMQAQGGAIPKKVKKRNNIWASVIGEQSLTAEIGVVGLKKLTGDRNVENYDFHAAQELAREESSNADMEEGEVEEQPTETSEMMAKRLSRKRPMCHRTYKPPPAPRPNACLDEMLVLATLDTDEGVSLAKLASDIAAALDEQKPQIIVNVVEVLGRDKTFELYEETCRIEKSGGMAILSGDRRRTSGGVFMQLLKQENLTKEQQTAIFPVDDAQQNWRRRRRAAHRRRNRPDHNTNGDSVSPSPDISRLPVCEELSDDEAIAGGSKCPGSTPVTSPAGSPGPTPTTTPIITPHCSDPEDERGPQRDTAKIIDTALAIVNAASPVPLDEEFVDVSVPQPQDEMDVV